VKEGRKSKWNREEEEIEDEEMEDSSESSTTLRPEYEMSECMHMQLAHSYVPWQFYETAFSPQEALMRGTLFPELYGVYEPPV
jgi:hypothetical protein